MSEVNLTQVRGEVKEALRRMEIFGPSGSILKPAHEALRRADELLNPQPKGRFYADRNYVKDTIFENEERHFTYASGRGEDFEDACKRAQRVADALNAYEVERHGENYPGETLED